MRSRELHRLTLHLLVSLFKANITPLKTLTLDQIIPIRSPV